MNTSNRLRIAIQKSGRLAEKSISLFMKCGLDFELHKNQLFQSSANFPIDLMLVRDDDIPSYVADGVCDLGIVGENILKEKVFSRSDAKPGTIEILSRLDFGYCRLSIAVPPTFNYIGVQSLEGKKIATSYPSCLKRFFRGKQRQSRNFGAWRVCRDCTGVGDRRRDLRSCLHRKHFAFEWLIRSRHPV